MKINYTSFLILGLAFILFSCKPKLDDKIDIKNYKADLKSMVNENEYLDILSAYEDKKYISPSEYDEMIIYLSNKDSLMFVKDFAYFNILFRIKYFEKIKEEIEEHKKKEELAKIAYRTNNITIYFRDTKKEVERKIKMDADSTSGAFYTRMDEKEYRIHLGDCKPSFSYSKGYGDDNERLDYFTITLDIHAASTYKDYYVGETKYAYESIIKHFEYLYGETRHYYPDLSSYSRGYGDRFTVAEWYIGDIRISVEMYEERELWDKNGYDSYETKYIVRAALYNFDKNLKGSGNE